MTVFDAYLDDSGSEPTAPVFVLGGFVAAAERWTGFEAAWRAALAVHPRLEYFKTGEAARLQQQFDRKRGWNAAERDGRLAMLTGVIAAHAQWQVHVAIGNRDFEDFIRRLPLANRRVAPDGPYLFLLMQVALELTAIGPCDLILDHQAGFGAGMLDWWPTFLHTAGVSHPNPPHFADDKEVLSLQAADLHAYRMRLQEIDGRGAPSFAMPSIRRRLDRSDILRLSDLLRETIARHAAENPRAPPIHPGKATSKRRHWR